MSKSEKELKQEFESDCKSDFHVTSDGHIEAYDEAMEIVSIKPSGVSYTENKMVDSPPHYNQGGIETIDYMRAYSTKEEFMGHCRLTTIKYLSRLMEKENPLQDAKKARWYLNKLIEELSNYE